MPNDLSPAKAPQTAMQRRIPAKVRKAIRIHVRQGRSKADAAGDVGMKPKTFYNSLIQDHVKELLEQEKALFLLDVENMREMYKMQAIEVAVDLMHNGKSEATRMKAVEFFAGERKANNVNVAVQVNNNSGEGYEYVRPNQQVVEITASTDSPSVAKEGEELSK